MNFFYHPQSAGLNYSGSISNMNLHYLSFWWCCLVPSYGCLSEVSYTYKILLWLKRISIGWMPISMISHNQNLKTLTDLFSAFRFAMLNYRRGRFHQYIEWSDTLFHKISLHILLVIQRCKGSQQCKLARFCFMSKWYAVGSMNLIGLNGWTYSDTIRLGTLRSSSIILIYACIICASM